MSPGQFSPPLRAYPRLLGRAKCIRCWSLVRAIELEGEICDYCAGALARHWAVAERYEAKAKWSA